MTKVEYQETKSSMNTVVIVNINIIVIVNISLKVNS